MPVSGGGGGLLSPWLCPIFGGTGCSSTSPTETPSSSSPSPSTANPPQIATSPPIDSPPPSGSGPGSTSSGHPQDVTSTAPPPASSVEHTRAATSPATPVHPTSHRAPPAPTFHLSSTSSLTSTLVSTGTPSDPSTPASFVGRGSSPILSSPTPTSPLPAHRSGLSTGAVIGIAVAIGVVANLLVLALCSYARRGRTRVQSSARADQPTDAAQGAGDRAHETAEDVTVRRQIRVRVSDSLCPRSRSRGEIDGTVHGSDKVLQDHTDRDGLNLAAGTGSTADGQMGAMVGIPVSAGYEVAYRRVTRHREIDGGVRIAGGRPGEGGFDQESMSDGSVTLPPPYPSHLDEEDTDEAIEAPGALGQYWGGSVRVE